MEKKLPFSAEDFRRVLGSPEGKRLLTLLRQDDGTVQQAMQAYRSGDAETAKALLQPLAQAPEAAALLQKMEGKEK